MIEDGGALDRGEIPAGWADKRAEDVCAVVQSGGTPKADGFTDGGGIPFLKVYNIRDQAIDFDYRPQYIKKEAHATIGRKSKVVPGDVLMNIVGPPLGKVAVVPADYAEWNCNQALTIFRPSEAVTTEWLYHFLRSGIPVSTVLGETRGVVGQVNISLSQCRNFRVPIPPLPEQRRIVAKLDRLSARSRAARDHLASTAKLAARAKQAILAAAFRGELTLDWRAQRSHAPVAASPDQIDARARNLDPLPTGWAWTAFSESGIVSGGLTKNPKRAAMEDRAPYLRVANVYANELRLGDVAMIGCTQAEIDQTTLVAGDLLVVEGNGSLDQIGRVALWRGDIEGCLHQNHIIRVRPRANLLPEFGLFWLLSPSGRAAIEAVASSSSGLHTLSISKVKGLPIPAVTLSEQREIVRRIEAAFARIDRMTAEAARAAHLLDRLDERLLAKAFRGELVPQDPADEPAEALLARIRAARAEAPVRRRGRART
jgi:type I restriction enzyme S subunit